MKITWVELDEDKNFKKGHDEPAVGRSLFMDPDLFDYTWLTTTITEILEQNENGYVHFHTKNSEYILIKD